MSNTVDNRVVEMQFKNEDFERGIKQTITSLNGLQEALKINTNALNLGRVQDEVDRLNFSNVSTAVEALSDRFSAMGIVGMSVIQRLTNGAIDLAARLGQITIGQIMTGGKGRAQKVADARFKLDGLLKDAEKVQSAFDSASKAVDGTAYGLDSAVSIASQLAASNVQLGDDMDSALRGVAGLAAMTGTSFEDMGNIFATVAGNGRLMGMQLTQISSRGINVAAELAKQMGTTEESIRDMVSKGQISFKQFASAMEAAFGDQAAKANETLTGALDNVRAALSRIGEIFYSGIIENKDFIKFINDIRVAINGVKKAMEPLKDTFAKLISSLSKFASSVLEAFQTEQLEKFVNYVSLSFDLLSKLIDGYTKQFEEFKKSLGISKEAEETAKEIRKIADDERKAAEDIVYRGLYGTGETRKKLVEEAGLDYKNVQDYVNALIQANYDAAKADEIYAKSVKETTKATSENFKHINSYSDYLSQVKGVTEKGYSKVELLIKALKNAVDSLVKSFKAIGKAFQTVFASKKNTKAIDYIVETIYNFSEALKITDERADKIQRTFQGVFSLFDILKTVVTSVVKVLIKAFIPTASTLGDAILTITAKLGDMIFNFNNFIKTNKTLHNVLDNIKDAFIKTIAFIREFKNAFAENVSFNNFLTTIKDISSSLIDTLFPAVDKAKDGVTDVTETLGEDKVSWIRSTADSISKFLEQVSQAIAKHKDDIVGFFDWLSEVFGKITKLFSKEKKPIKKDAEEISESVSEPVGIIGIAMSYLKKIFEKTKPVIKDLFKDLIEDIKNLTPGQIAILGISSALIVFLLTLSTVASAAKKFVNRFARIGDEIANTIKSIKDRIDEFKKDKKRAYNLAILKSLTILIGVLALSLYKLAQVDTKKLLIAAGVLTALVGITVLLADHIGKFGEKFKMFADQMKVANHIEVMESLLKTLARVILVLAASVVIISKINTEDIWVKLTAFTVILSEMILTMMILSKYVPELSENSGALVALASSILILSISLSILSKFEPKNTITSAIAIGITLVALGAALYLASKNADKVKILPLILMIVALTTIAVSLAGLAIINKFAGGIIRAAISLAIVLGSLIVAYKAMDELSSSSEGEKDSYKKTAALVSSLTSTVFMLSLAIKNVAEIKSYGKLIAAVSSIIIILYMVVKMAEEIAMMPDIAKGKLTGLILMIVLLISITSTLKTLLKGNYKWENMAASTLSVVMLLAALVGVYFALEQIPGGMAMKGKVAALILIITMLKPIAEAIKELAGFNWKQMAASVAAMALVMYSIVGALAILSIVGGTPEGMLAMIVAAGALAAVALSMGAVAKLFASAIKTVVQSIEQLTQIEYEKINIDVLNQLLGLLLKLGLISAVSAVGFIALGASMLIFGAGLALVGVGVKLIVEPISKLINSITRLILVMAPLTNSAGNIAKGILTIGAAIGKMIQALGVSLALGFVSFIQTIQMNAVLVGTAIKNLILTVLDILISAKIDIVEKLINGLTDMFTMLEGVLPALFEHFNNVIIECLAEIAANARIYGYFGMIIASEFLIGMANGLSEEADELIESAVYLTMQIIKAIKDTFDQYKGVVGEKFKETMSSGSAKFWKGVAKAEKLPFLKNIANENAEMMEEEAKMHRSNFDEELEEAERKHNEKRGEENIAAYYKGQEVAAKAYDTSATKEAVANKTATILDHGEEAAATGSDTANKYLNYLGFGDLSIADASTARIGRVTSDIVSIGGGKGVEEGTKAVTMKVAGLPQAMVDSMMANGWKLNEAGTDLVKEVSDGAEEGAKGSEGNGVLDAFSSLLGLDGGTDGLGGIFESFAGEMTDNADESGGNFIDGLLGKLNDPEALASLGDAASLDAETIKNKFNETLKIESPSKEAMESSGYWMDGLLIPMQTRNEELARAAINNAHSISSSFNSAINEQTANGMAFTPVIRPVVDSESMKQVDGAIGVLNNPATMKLAADSTMTVQNSDQERLAQQIDALSKEVNALANKDISKAFKEVQFNVNANTSVDGKVLRKTSAAYTIDQIDRKERAIIMSKGGRA